VSIDSFWNSSEADEYRRIWNVMSTARCSVSAKPVGKKAKGVARQRDWILAATKEWQRAYRNGGWPRPKADVALDVVAITNKDAPRPENFAKGLLDLLGASKGDPIVYYDDRQVSMLFVRVDEFAPAEPEIHFAAQRASVIRDLIRRTGNSRRRDAEYEEQQRRREASTDADWEAVSDWHGDTSDLGKRIYNRALRSLRFGVQEDALSAVDHLSRHLVESNASLRARDPEEFYELTASSLDLLGSMPYALNLGRLPAKKGETATFRESLHAALAARVKDYPNLYPLQHPVGLTAFVVPGPAGKDADNVFRDLVVPILLDQIQPPRQARYPYSDDADAHDKAAQPHIHFIETINLTGIPRAPGTLVVALSLGYRRRSWWQQAVDDDALP
jgi:hypothetical protein